MDAHCCYWLIATIELLTVVSDNNINAGIFIIRTGIASTLIPNRNKK